MGTFFQTIIFAAAASVMINGVSIGAKDILQSAQQSADLLSKHSLEIALESYYLDHQSYPQTHDSKTLIKELRQGSYIKNGPDDASVFHYHYLSGGQNYELELM